MNKDEFEIVNSCDDSDQSEDYDSDSMEKELSFEMSNFKAGSSKEQTSYMADDSDHNTPVETPDRVDSLKTTTSDTMPVTEPTAPEIAYVICRSIPCVVPFRKTENEHSNMGRVRDHGKMLFEVGKDSDITNLVNGPESNWPSAKTFDPSAIVVIKGRTAIDTPLYTPLHEGPFVW